MDENETTQLEKLKKELSYIKEQYTSLESMFQMTTVHLKKVPLPSSRLAAVFEWLPLHSAKEDALEHREMLLWPSPQQTLSAS